MQENHFIPRHISPLKNNSKNYRKMYFNSLSVINGEFSQHASMPHHLMSCHLSPLKNISKNLRSMPHHLMPHHLSPLKNNSKNQENHLLPHHLSIENNCKNSKKIT